MEIKKQERMLIRAESTLRGVRHIYWQAIQIGEPPS